MEEKSEDENAEQKRDECAETNASKAEEQKNRRQEEALLFWRSLCRGVRTVVNAEKARTLLRSGAEQRKGRGTESIRRSTCALRFCRAIAFIVWRSIVVIRHRSKSCQFHPFADKSADVERVDKLASRTIAMILRLTMEEQGTQCP
jgi:hypothetical protein